MKNVQVSFGTDKNISAMAEIGGPLFLEIFSLQTIQPSGSFISDNVIKKGEEFDIVMRVFFRDVLSELKVNYIASINVLNLETGTKSVAYSFQDKGTLPGGGVTTMTLRNKFTATETGIFLLSASMGFPESKLYDFSLGSIAGSEPPFPVGPRLRIANFFVFDPTA